MRVRLPKLRLSRLVSTQNIGTTLLLGVFVLVVSTYAVYQLQKIISPFINADNPTTRIELRASDRTGVANTSAPLQNLINGNGTPNYDYNVTANGPTILPNNTLFRIQGQVYYKGK